MRLGHRILQALFVSVIAAKLVSIVSERFVPLVGLLRLSLVFPDVAPSRFGVALKAGSTKKLSDQIPTLSGDAGEAARQAIEFVTRSQKHDRLTRGLWNGCVRTPK